MFKILAHYLVVIYVHQGDYVDAYAPRGWQFYKTPAYNGI